METSASVMSQISIQKKGVLGREKTSTFKTGALLGVCGVVNGNTVMGALELSRKATARRVERARPENGDSWPDVKWRFELIATLK